MFGWTYLDATGAELGASQTFADAEAAEAWISESWPDLLANGVEQVALHDHTHDRRVYRMGLGAE